MSDRIDHITCHDNCSCQPHMQAAEKLTKELEDGWYLVKCRYPSQGPEVLFKRGVLLFRSSDDTEPDVEGSISSYEFLNTVVFLSL